MFLGLREPKAYTLSSWFIRLEGTESLYVSFVVFRLEGTEKSIRFLRGFFYVSDEICHACMSRMYRW